MENSTLHRKQAIVFTAIDVINQFGIQAISTKEIANRQGIAESTVFKHFKTKNDIILAVLEHYSQFDSDIMFSAKEQSNHPLEAVTLFMKAYAEYYENYPAITAITQSYDALLYNPELAVKVKNIIDSRTQFIKTQLDEAKRLKMILPEVDSEDLTDIISGTSVRLCLKWRMNRYNFSLKEKILNILQLVLKSFQL